MLKQPVKASGTEPNSNLDSILAGELAKLSERRVQIKDSNQKYIDNHPELRTLLDDFISSIIVNKPHDIIKFGSHYFGTLRSGGMGPCPLVFAGPSGVGKGTIITMLMQKYPRFFGFSVSHTTRPSRPGEVDGVHYNFVSMDEMKAAIDKGEFIEHAFVHTNLYGTSFAAVDRVRKEGKICILDIDVQGVRTVKKSSMDCKYVFIMPPSKDELERRLRDRKTETEEKIKIRLKNAADEIAYGQEPGQFDAVVVNTDLQAAFQEVIAQLQILYPDFDFGDELSSHSSESEASTGR